MGSQLQCCGSMETSVEHAGRPPRPRLTLSALRREKSRQRLQQQRQGLAEAPAPAGQAHDHLQQQQQRGLPVGEPARTARAALAATAARAAAFFVRRWPGAAVQGACLLLALGLPAFLRDVVIQMVEQGQAAAAGALCVAAVEQGAAGMVQAVCRELLAAGCAHVAAAVAEAFWHIAAAAGWQPYPAASLLAPPVVAAVDEGGVAAVGRTAQLLFNARLQPLLMWLVEAIVGALERPDAAAAIAWEAMQRPGGTVAVADLLALLMVDRHHRTAAALAQHLYDRSAEHDGATELALIESLCDHTGSSAASDCLPPPLMYPACIAPPPQVSAVLAAGNAQAIEAGRVADVVTVCWLLLEEGRVQLLADALSALTQRQPGGRECAGELCWHAITTGREQLVVATASQLLRLGRAGVAADSLHALYALGHPLQAARVAAEVVVAVVDGGGSSAVAAAAASNVLLWRCGAVPLLRDVQLALARKGRADVAAGVSWHALQRGEAEMVSAVAAAVVRSRQAREAAELSGRLAEASGQSPAAAQALARAVVAAVRAGSAGEVARVAAQLVSLGHGALLRGIVSAMLELGHAEELGTLGKVAAQLQPVTSSLQELSALLAAPSPSPPGDEHAEKGGA